MAINERNILSNNPFSVPLPMEGRNHEGEGQEEVSILSAYYQNNKLK